MRQSLWIRAYLYSIFYLIAACGAELNDPSEKRSDAKQTFPAVSDCASEGAKVISDGGRLTLKVTGNKYEDQIEYHCVATPHINKEGQLYFQFYEKYPNNKISLYMTLFPPLTVGSYPVVSLGHPKASSAFFGVSLKTTQSEKYDEIFQSGGAATLGVVEVEHYDGSEISGRIEGLNLYILDTETTLQLSGTFRVKNLN